MTIINWTEVKCGECNCDVTTKHSLIDGLCDDCYGD